MTPGSAMSIQQSFGVFPGIPVQGPLSKQLFNGSAEMDCERDPSSARITVTLHAFERRWWGAPYSRCYELPPKAEFVETDDESPGPA